MISIEKIEISDPLDGVIRDFVINGIAENPFLTLDDIEQSRAKGFIDVYGIYLDGRITGAAAVEYLVNARKEKHLNIVGIGCSFGTYKSRIEILTGLERIANANGCARIFASGRSGWIKLAEELGYSTAQHVIFWKNLEGQHD